VLLDRRITFLAALAAMLTTACDPPPASPPATAPPATPVTVTLTPLPKLRPDLMQVYGLIRARQTIGARMLLEQRLAQSKGDGQATFLLGMTYHREKRYAKSRECFDEAIRLDPEYFLSHYFKAWALYYLGELGPSRAAFEKYLSYGPGRAAVADSEFGLGLIDLDEDRLDAAEARFRKAIELLGQRSPPDADLSKAYARLGEVFERRGDFAAARTAMERSVALFPDHYEAWWKLYRVLVRLGDDAAAAAALKQHDAAKERMHPGVRSAFPD
jgi:tetratricopeptide (TPR) repeat protein